MDISIRKIVLLLGVILLLIQSPAWAAKKTFHVDWNSKLKTGKTASTKNLNFATPLVVSERVYIGDYGGYFYSINLVSGKKLWELKVDGPVESQPAYDNGTLFFGDGKGKVYAVNSDTGEIIWNIYIGEEVMTKPAVGTSKIFVATQNNSVFALDKSTGGIKWNASRAMPFSSLTIKGFSDPVLIDGKIYVGNTDGVVVVYAEESGKKISTIPLAAGRGQFTDIDATPLQVNGQMIFSSMEGVLVSVDAKTKKDRWSQTIGTPNNITYSAGNLYATTRGKIYALNAENGDIIWEKDLEVPELSAPAVGNSYMVVVSTRDRIYLLDKATGDVVTERHLGGGTYGSPILSDERLLVLTNSGQLFSFWFRESDI